MINTCMICGATPIPDNPLYGVHSIMSDYVPYVHYDDETRLRVCTETYQYALNPFNINLLAKQGLTVLCEDCVYACDQGYCILYPVCTIEVDKALVKAGVLLD
jgi:hypothetical protein